MSAEVVPLTSSGAVSAEDQNEMAGAGHPQPTMMKKKLPALTHSADQQYPLGREVGMRFQELTPLSGMAVAAAGREAKGEPSPRSTKADAVAQSVLMDVPPAPSPNVTPYLADRGSHSRASLSVAKYETNIDDQETFVRRMTSGAMKIEFDAKVHGMMAKYDKNKDGEFGEDEVKMMLQDMLYQEYEQKMKEAAAKRIAEDLNSKTVRWSEWASECVCVCSCARLIRRRDLVLGEEKGPSLLPQEAARVRSTKTQQR